MTVFDIDMGTQIRKKRYEAYNMEWVELAMQEDQMAMKEGYQYGGSSASLISSVMSPTSVEVTRRSSRNNVSSTPVLPVLSIVPLMVFPWYLLA